MLTAQASRARLLFEAIGVAAVVVELGADGPGLVLDANADAVRLLGIVPRVRLDQQMPDFIPRDLNPTYPEHLARLRATGSAIYEATVRTPSGDLVPVEASSRLATVDDQDVAVVVLRDLRPRNAAERELRASEARYRALFDAVADAVVAFELDASGRPGRVVEANAAAAALTGLSRAEMEGRPVLDLFRMTETPRLAAARAELIGSGFVRYEDDVHTPQRTIPAQLTSRRVTLDGAQLQVSVFRDLTAERRLQAERAQALSALTDAHERLVTSQEEERRAIARELHDEVGQILTLLAIRLDLAAADAAVPSAHIPAARALVSDLLARIRRLSLDLRPAILDDFGLLPAMEGLFSRYSAHTALTVDFAHAGIDRRFSVATETTAFRIVQEALTNVARHSGASGVSVSASADATYLTIEIEDSGRGFSPRPVDPGAPPESAATPPATLGLDGMRERAARVGGEVTVETGANGTAILVRLPVRDVAGASG